LEICHLAGFDLQQGDGLLILRGKSTVTGINHRQVTPVRGDGHGHGQAVQALRAARHWFHQLLAGGEVDRVAGTLCRRSSRRQKGPHDTDTAEIFCQGQYPIMLNTSH
jgi:hypothetical protein